MTLSFTRNACQNYRYLKHATKYELALFRILVGHEILDEQVEQYDKMFKAIDVGEPEGQISIDEMIASLRSTGLFEDGDHEGVSILALESIFIRLDMDG